MSTPTHDEMLDAPEATNSFGGMYKQFKTDTALEAKGVIIDYGNFRVTLARAGGGNKRFARLLEAKTKPYRRAIQTETMDDDRAQELLCEVYAEAVILKWEAKVDGKWQVGIEPPPPKAPSEGQKSGGKKLLPFNTANVVSTLKNLPELFRDLQEQANKVAIYRENVLEDDAGN